MKPVLPFLLCLALLSAVTGQRRSTSAKASPVSANKLVAFKVTGTTRYTEKEILAASGLQIGQQAADGDFKEAVQLLGDSGMFSNVAYAYSSSATGVKVEIQLGDIDQSKLVPAQFENFVWFGDDELRVTLETRVPLFKRLLPLGGNLADRVSEALQAILSEKHLPGRVDYMREARDQTGGTLVAIDYRVEEVSIRIHGIEFPGASPEQASLLATATRRVIGGEYARPRLAAIAKFDLMPVYLQRGYLKAQFAPSEARVVTQPPNPEATGAAEVEVDAILPVTPGKVYLTTGVDWKGNSAIAASEIAPLLHLPLGRPADAVRLLRDIENAEKLYRSRGYMMVQVKSDAQLDDEKGAVHYVLNVAEGDLYKMGELEILGLDTQATARMRAAWTLHEGQPYDADYPKKFLDDTRQLVPRGVQWDVSVHATPEMKDKTVDVEIRFKQQ